MVVSPDLINYQSVLNSGFPDFVDKVGAIIDHTAAPGYTSKDQLLTRGVYGTCPDRTYVSVITGNTPGSLGNQEVWVGQWPIPKEGTPLQDKTLYFYTPTTESVAAFHLQAAETFADALGGITATRVDDVTLAAQIKRVAIEKGLQCLEESRKLVPLTSTSTEGDIKRNTKIREARKELQSH